MQHDARTVSWRPVEGMTDQERDEETDKLIARLGELAEGTKDLKREAPGSVGAWRAPFQGVEGCSSTAAREQAHTPLRGRPSRKEMAMAEFPPIGHVAVTVTDVDTARDWYGRLFQTDPALDEDAGGFYHVVYALGGTLFGVHGHEGTEPGERMDERRVGLDHVAFACSDRDDLKRWQQHLDDLGIEHGSIKDAPYGSGVSFRDPDNNALEFFAPPAG